MMLLIAVLPFLRVIRQATENAMSRFRVSPLEVFEAIMGAQDSPDGKRRTYKGGILEWIFDLTKDGGIRKTTIKRNGLIVFERYSGESSN